jgi:arginine deiminase
MDSPLQINSEIGRLKTVLLHRPGGELENLTPEYLGSLLFDDIPFLEKAREEHDAFAQLLRGRNVEVLYLEDLIAESLSTHEIRTQFLNTMLQSSKQGERRITKALFDYLMSSDVKTMVQRIMSGVRKNEVQLSGDRTAQLHEMLASSYPFYLDPMPNLYFTRDPSAVIGNGLTINRMHWPARRRESLFMEYIIRYHPRFSGSSIPVWYDRDNRFSIEGGDELVLSRDVVAIGVSERTTAEAIEAVATKLFSESSFTKVIAVEIPKSRAFMHLDTVFTMIDYDKFTIHPAIRDRGGKMNLFILTPGEDSEHPHIERKDDLAEVLKDVLNLDQIALIECGGGDVIASARYPCNRSRRGGNL